MNPVSKVKFAKACKVSRQAIYKAIPTGHVEMRADGKIDLDNKTNISYMEQALARAADKAASSGKPSGEKKPKESSTSKKRVTAGTDKPSGKSVSESAAEDGEGAVISDAEMEGEPGQRTLDYDSVNLDGLDPALQEILLHGIGDNKKVSLDAMKSLEQIKTQIQDRLSKRNLLIDRVLVRELLGRLWSVDTTELRTLFIRMAPMVAALVQNGVEHIIKENPTYKDNPILLKVNEFVNSTEFMQDINTAGTEEVMKILAHSKRIINEFLDEMGSTPMKEPEAEPKAAEEQTAEVTK